MAILWSILWGLITPAVMVLTIQYYLPRLYLRAQKSNSEAPEHSGEKDAELEAANASEKKDLQKYTCESILLKNKWVRLGLLVCATVFAVLCGYAAGDFGTSTLGQLKMTITFAVLACVFITDLELFLIPNMCSLVLLGSRVLLILAELIWARDSVVANLIDSAAALGLSLFVLLIMALLTRGGIGMGDVKLFSCIGFMCGFRAVCYTLIMALLACALTSTLCLLTRKKGLKDSLPLGPFILIGFGTSVLLTLI